MVYEEGKTWAEARGFLYFETSSYSGQNVIEMFRTLVSQIIDVVVRKEKPPNNPSRLGYTYEQVDAVHCIRTGVDNYEMLGIKKGSSRYYRIY